MRDRRALADERGRGRVRALAAPVHGDRRGHRRRPPALPLGGRGRRGHARRGARRRSALPAQRAAPRGARRAVDPAEDVPAVDDPKDLLLRLLAAPNICAKTWVYEQYDQVVGSGTVARPGQRCGRGAADAVRPRDRRGARRRRRARRARSRAAAAPRRSRRRRSTSPAAAPSPPRSRTASTSAIRSARARPTRCARRSRAWPRPARCSARPSSRATSRSTTRAAASRSTRRRSSAASACCERAESAVPMAPADEAGTLFAARRPRARLRRLRVAGARRGRERRPHPRGRPARAALALRPARPSSRATGGLLRSAHDVSDGGLAVALAELAMAAECGLDVAIEPARRRRGDALRRVLRPRDRELSRPETRTRLVEACDAAGVPVERIGALGGAAIALRCGELALELPRRRRPRGLRGHAPRTRWRPADVRRLRHPRARSRRRAARVLRALRAAAPRPGERRHRRLRRPPRA